MELELIVSFIRRVFKEENGLIPLHAPYFGGNEKKYVTETIDSTFVSSVGAYVNKFEEMICELTGAKYAIATVNGTTALHLALLLAGVKHGDEVITQPLTFVATANAISHVGGVPIFVDVDKDTMGMSPLKLEQFLYKNTYLDKSGNCINKGSQKRIAACIPMHTFGFPLRIDEIAAICKKYNIILVEDAAESIGSYYKEKHTGTFGLLGIFSFNGNKIITCGGGGIVVTNDEVLARKAKHISTTAKIPHPWEFVHDEIAYNYRMPNLNAAMACAQLEQLKDFLNSKRKLANIYKDFFKFSDITFVESIQNGIANHWLNAIILPNMESKENFLTISNSSGVITRPIWRLMPKLSMYKNCETTTLENAAWLEDRIVNIPSSVHMD